MLALVEGFSTQASAQDTDKPWSEPRNLSLSGAATEPQLVISDDGAIHVIWKDTVAESFVYMVGDLGSWSDPIFIEVPFGTAYSTIMRLRRTPRRNGRSAGGRQYDSR